jgi:hypothetical protein
MLGSTLLPTPLATADDGQADVPFWHLAEMSAALIDVRYRGADSTDQRNTF